MVETTLSVTYASGAGSADIASGQLKVDQCYLGWDSTGNRNYQIAVPLNTALNLTATSSVATVHDQNGNQLAEKDTVGVQAATPAALAPLNFTLHRKSP